MLVFCRRVFRGTLGMWKLRLCLQDRGIEYLESNPRMLSAQRAARPFAFQLPEDVPAFRDGQKPPLHLGHKQTPAVLRVGCHEIELDTSLPVTLRAGKSGPAKILEEGRRMVVNKFVLLLRGVSPPQGLMRRIHTEPEAHRRVGDAVKGLLGGPQALSKGQFTGQDGGVQELLQ